MIYVYTHSSNGVVFYVGCGAKYRPKSKNRTPVWHDFVNSIDGKYDIEIISKHRSRDLALRVEKDLIGKLLPICNINSRPYTIIETSIRVSPENAEKLQRDADKAGRELSVYLADIVKLSLK